MVEKVTTIHFDIIDSTYTYAKENYHHFEEDAITRITADQQLKGRGRFKRKWFSPKGLNIYLTYYFTLTKDLAKLNNLAQVLSLSISKLLTKKGVQPQIKWPNDVLVNHKKISGILCEVIDLQTKIGVILGVGINVNMPQSLLEEIDQPATSLLVETGEKHCLEDVIKTLDTFFISDYALYKVEGFKPFYASYNALISHKKIPIIIKQNHHKISGTFHSLNFDGRLNLLLPNGEIQTFSSGEIERYS